MCRFVPLWLRDRNGSPVAIALAQVRGSSSRLLPSIIPQLRIDVLHVKVIHMRLQVERSLLVDFSRLDEVVVITLFHNRLSDLHRNETLVDGWSLERIRLLVDTDPHSFLYQMWQTRDKWSIVITRARIRGSSIWLPKDIISPPEIIAREGVFKPVFGKLLDNSRVDRCLVADN